MQEIIDYYGEDHQKDKALEEMVELQKEILKEKDGKGDIRHIIEELADVNVVLQQIQLIYNIPDEKLEIEAQKKIERALDEMEGECNEIIR